MAASKGTAMTTTQTTTAKSATQQTRRFDHVYDPVYAVAGERDFARNTQQAMITSVAKVPNRENLFSEIPTVYKSHCYRVTTKSDLPAHVDAKFRPSQGATAGGVNSSAVSGSQRHKYFRRPVVPVLHSAPPEILLAQGASDDEVTREMETRRQLEAAAAAAAQDAQEGKVVDDVSGHTTQGTQTRVRESEAQTDPYTPAYVIPAGADQEPEILALAGLKHGEGLPATMREVKMIERARAKKKFLASLPPITDEASFNLRKRMMEEQELLEFKYREEDIDRVQAEHLRLLSNALHDREAETEFQSKQRIEAMRQQKLDQKDAQLMAIQKQRVKQLRKLAKRRSMVDPQTPSHEMIHEYSNFASKTYAPLLRDGKHDLKSIRDTDARPRHLFDYNGFQQLESSADPKLTNIEIKRPRRVKGRSSIERKRQAHLKDLEWMDNLLRSRKDGQDGATSEAKVAEDADEDEAQPFWRKRAEKLERPPTPCAASASRSDLDQQELSTAITLLQRLLRGRAIQNMMYEGKTKRLDLIQELRTDEIFGPEVSESGAVDPESKLDVDHRHGNEEKQAEVATLQAIQGEVVSSTLDVLSKELVRVQQERQIFSLVSNAVEKRRRREMLQAGTRQAELEQREREDEVYRQLMLVHQGTVDSYFDELLAESIEDAAADTAHMQVTSTKRPSSATGSAPGSARNGQTSDADVVQGLVSSFLLPHVQRENVRSKIEMQERRFVHAAHSSIYSALSTLDDADQEEKKCAD
ncbi:Cilia- and flagella-associated protein 91 (CFAP91) (AMY-1-associating protein expressed in testis 1 homolog) (AAT-1) (MYCBP/AMY-1-associated testis-expressed protein 1) (Protein MAATS1) [Durusdinium trenchii]|uniref:Cilia- and flagella-associated protein 91 n=1 Tax=Durusdinium trenchii TaxID=1381693 RepID=A0ABP0JYC1_9DINO